MSQRPRTAHWWWRRPAGFFVSLRTGCSPDSRRSSRPPGGSLLPRTGRHTASRAKGSSRCHGRARCAASPRSTILPRSRGVAAGGCRRRSAAHGLRPRRKRPGTSSAGQRPASGGAGPRGRRQHLLRHRSRRVAHRPAAVGPDRHLPRRRRRVRQPSAEPHPRPARTALARRPLFRSAPGAGHANRRPAPSLPGAPDVAVRGHRGPGRPHRRHHLLRRAGHLRARRRRLHPSHRSGHHVANRLRRTAALRAP